MRKLIPLLILIALTLPLCGQINGELQYIGPKAILQVWGTHFQRGEAQGYFLADPIMEVFDQFYYLWVAQYNPVFYNYLMNYYQEHFDTDPRMLSEAQGVIAGISAAGVSLYHSGLQRDLTAEDLLLSNAFLDMSQIRGSYGSEPLELGCSSLSSWGVSTQQDSLLQGSAVITRLLDWTQISTLIANPVLIVHHPAEADEQTWLNFTFPGLIGALSALSSAGTWASLNVGNDHYATNTQGLDPVFFDLRRGIERLDLNYDDVSNPLDVFASLNAGNHLSGTIIHTLAEQDGDVQTVVIETNNSGTALRYFDNNGNLPGNHLAATNHFRWLVNPTCCNRYDNIQDSLYANHNVTAKRQWNVLTGAAGLETNLAALQYTPSTGNLLWASALTGLPAYQNPAISLNANTLFSYNVSADDTAIPAPALSLQLYPNPLARGGTLNLKSGTSFDRCEVFNLRGQKVWSRILDQRGANVSLDLPDFPAGLYLLKVSDGQGSGASKKLLVVP